MVSFKFWSPHTSFWFIILCIVGTLDSTWKSFSYFKVLKICFIVQELKIIQPSWQRTYDWTTAKSVSFVFEFANRYWKILQNSTWFLKWREETRKRITRWRYTIRMKGLTIWTTWSKTTLLKVNGLVELLKESES